MNLESVISEAVDIPPVAKIFPKLLKTLKDPNSEMQDIIELLKVDVTLSANILRYANGSYYGNGTPTNGLEAAIQRIGVSEVNRLVSIAASKSVLDKPLIAYNIKEGEMIEDSLATAQLMHALGCQIDRDLADTFYTTGLLHAIGKIVINQYLKTRGMSLYGGNDLTTETTQDISTEFERKILGFDHAEAGAALIQSWSFAPDMVDAIRHQHSPETAPGEIQLTACLNFSNKIGPIFRLTESSPICAITEEICTRIGLKAEQIQACMDRAFVDYQEVLDVLNN